MSESKPTVLLKISGEALSGESCFGHEAEPMQYIAREIDSVAKLCNLAVVVGGGNLIRGSVLRQKIEFPETSDVPDYAGMLATIINSIILQEVLEHDFKLDTRVCSEIPIPKVCEHFAIRKVKSHLSKGRVVIFAAGTGSPNFSTDTAMVLKAQEIAADMILKGTKVDGVYDKDPKTNGDAKRIPEIGFKDYIAKDLKIVDDTAAAMASNGKIPIIVFNIFEAGNLEKVVRGEEEIGSHIL